MKNGAAPRVRSGTPDARPNARCENGLDPTDIAILAEFQANGRISKNELAFRLGISPPQCLRRLRALQSRSIIKGVRALVDAQLLNYDLVMFAMVTLHSQSQIELDAFERFIEKQTIVRESWLLSGETDYMLKCVARELAGIRRFIDALTSIPNVHRIRTSLALHNVIDAPIIPLSPLLVRSCKETRLSCAAEYGLPSTASLQD